MTQEDLQKKLEEALKARMSLTDKQMRQLVISLKDNIENLIQPKIEVFERGLKNTNNKVDTLQAQVTLLEQELTNDRQNLGEIKVKTASIEQRVKDIFETLLTLPNSIITGIKNDMNRQEDRITDKIEEKVPNAVSEAVLGSLEPKKEKFVSKPKRSLWGKIKPYLQRS